MSVRRDFSTVLGALALVLAIASSARAQQATPAAAQATTPAGESTAGEQRLADDRAGEMGMEDDLEGDGPTIAPREIPDYDGRPEPGMTAGEALLWIPRVIFWPVYAFLDYVIRRPLGFILTTGEREQWDALQFPPFAETEPEWGLLPTIFVDFGFQPSGGLYLWTDNVLARRNGMRFQVGFGGLDWLRAGVLDRYLFDERGDAIFEAQVEAWMRPDRLFLGIGGDASPSRVSRFGRRQIDGSVAFAFRPWRASFLRISTGVSANEFYDGSYVDRSDGQVPISEAFAQGWFERPPGFDGYTSYWQRIEGAIDTRQPRPVLESGLRVEAHLEQGFDVTRALDRRWLIYGGGVGAFWEVDAGRTFGLWVVSSFATQLGSDPVPFTELPDLGGRGRMTAFRQGWLIGESIIAADLEYRYPIWVSVDGFVNVSTGNAFGPALGNFDAERLRMSFALGLRTVGDPDQSFTLQIGMGTSTFAEGLDPAILRLTAGMQEGF
ncbi:MAG: hypothetical protein M3Y87_23170 [Myxococcota bacterium]|nr:hypothetical protein [Myxococcota bacterium]